jgi:hypothetical protein
MCGSYRRRSHWALSRGLSGLAEWKARNAPKAISIQRRAAGSCGLEEFRLVQDAIGDYTLARNTGERLLYATDDQYPSVLKYSRRMRVSASV